MPTKYIIKTGVRPFVSTLRKVRYVEISKPTGKSMLGMVIMRGTGKYDKDKLVIEPVRDIGFHVAADRTAIKKKIRVLRDTEAAEMQALNERKNEALQRAWDKGNVVTVKELTDLIE